MSVAASGRKECLKLLIVAGADVNAKDHRGKTALWFACHYAKADCFDLLVKSGANVNSIDLNSFF